MIGRPTKHADATPKGAQPSGTRATMAAWLGALTDLVQKRPLVVLKFNQITWRHLEASRKGPNEFTFAKPHSSVSGVKAPTACLLLDESETQPAAYFGHLSSCKAITTLDSRIRVRRAQVVQPATKGELLDLIHDAGHRTHLIKRLDNQKSVVSLSPKLSASLIGALAAIPSNTKALQAVAATLAAPKHFNGPAALQQDAVNTALAAFGLSIHHQASHLEITPDGETALARVNVIEDGVIEHDARRVPGYRLVGSDITGRAVFKKDQERLEVFTANRRSLENVLGVDLIYVNTTRRNVVMLQYKMLEPPDQSSGADWIYRPDNQLEEEIVRMQRFASAEPPSAHEYRLSSQVFYLKFVKRDAAISRSGIVMPIDHFEALRTDPAARGPRGGFRISFEALDGRYLRSAAFLNLVQSGYLGSHAKTTSTLEGLIEAILAGGHAVVAAVQRSETAAEA